MIPRRWASSSARARVRTGRAAEIGRADAVRGVARGVGALHLGGHRSTLAVAVGRPLDRSIIDAPERPDKGRTNGAPGRGWLAHPRPAAMSLRRAGSDLAG